ncbi:hypothetical protein IWQ60_000680 [Tieghemiomyces parasiticus]|uniref:Splicing factor Cactin n=1 Tax=Tieghemiomyces parasiticus TaxID=78921 RepID=A0A9W8AIF1_9FUNG|nr:hypothetical protein IWQ60_000680 [Tieghemiomyces parasiticus]
MPRSRSPSARRCRRHSRERSSTRSGRPSRSHHQSEDRSPLRRDHRRRRRHRDRTRSPSPSSSRRRNIEHSTATDTADVMPTAVSHPTGYTSLDNRFDSAQLQDKFVWKKKAEQEKSKGLSSQQRKEQEAARRAEAAEELRKLAERKVQRELVRQARQDEEDRKRRAAEIAAFGDWEAQEEEFHLKQAKRRAEVRIKEGRAKAIDLLAMNLRLVQDDSEDKKRLLTDAGDEGDADLDIEIDVNEPYSVCDDLSHAELTELFQEINFYLSLERDQQSREFWTCLRVVCEARLQEVGAAENGNAAPPTLLANDEVTQIFAGKGYEALITLENQIDRKLKSNEPVDVDYWEAVRKLLAVHKAKARLREIHEQILLKRLEQLHQKQLAEALREKEDLAAEIDMPDALRSDEEATGEAADDRAAGVPAENVPSADKAITANHYHPGMSPKLMPQAPSDVPDLPILSAAEDARALHAARLRVLRQQFVAKRDGLRHRANLDTTGESDLASLLLKEEAARGMSYSQEVFNTEAQLESTASSTKYQWQDKYRPRKPRFFNRIITGFDWNKFNRVHYDDDNPPPKVVQGYQFNIFYPDLIDKTVAPSYVVDKDPTSDETVILRFSAGPPYEDIAFRIINKDWELLRRRGFRNVFDRGTLQLHFNFKRLYYRR